MRPTSLHRHSIAAREFWLLAPRTRPPLPAGFPREEGPKNEIRKVTGKKLPGFARAVYSVLKFSAAPACPWVPVSGSVIATVPDNGYRRRRDKKLFC